MNRYVLLAVLAVLTDAPCLSAESTVFQIGAPDNSYCEFALGSDYQRDSAAFGQTLVFNPASDEWQALFPSILPGPADSWAGSSNHAVEIKFSLADPAGVYRLVIDLADAHEHRPPVWEIELNGKTALWRLTSGAGDASLSHLGLGREQALTLELPSDLFRQGANTISIKSLEGSWALFDCITLTNDPAAKLDPGIKSFQATQSRMLMRSNGSLKNPVAIAADCSPGTPAFDATLESGKRLHALRLEPDLMGRASAEALVDEVQAPTDAVIRAASGNVLDHHFQLKPVRHWKVFVMPSSHVDIGYTAYQPDVRDFHFANIELALDLADKHPSFVFNTEAAWVEESFLSSASPDRRKQFIDAARRGQIGCQAIYGNMLTGICSHEGLIRTLYCAAEASRQHGIPFDMAVSSDVPTQVWTLPGVLAGAGIRYFAAGLNLTRGNSFDRLFSKSPFWWEGPDGSRVLAWLWPGYAAASNLGLASGIETARPRIEQALTGYDRKDYPYDAVLAFGGFSDNVGLDANLATAVEQWNAKYAFPQVVLCRGPEFFQHIERNFASSIPTIRGDGGVYWEDGAASTAAETAMNRIAKEQLVTAEKLFSLTGGAYPIGDLNRAWRAALLYDEHTWGAAESISEPESAMTKKQWAYKAAFARQASSDASALLKRAIQRLADAAPEGSFVVFNPNSYATSGLVALNNSAFQQSGNQTFWAEDVPPCGYKVFSALESTPTDKPSAVPADAMVFENRYYRLKLAPGTGAVSSLMDLEDNRELVDGTSKLGLNQYLYYQGRGPEATDVTATTGVTVTQAAHPLGRQITVSGSSFNTPRWTSVILLYDNAKRIDFDNRIEKTSTYSTEAGYFAFPFRGDGRFQVELPNGLMQPGKDSLDGACMSWYAVQDFAAVQSGDSAVIFTPVDSPLITLCDTNRDSFTSPLPLTNGRLFAYVFNNYWFTNYKAAQGGDLRFRFSITSQPKYDPAAAARFGQLVRSPLIAAAGTAASGIRYQREKSLCRVDAPNVSIQTVKKAQTGEGTIVRLRELSGRATTATLTIATPVAEAWKCDLVERPIGKLPHSRRSLKVNLPPSGMLTLLIR